MHRYGAALVLLVTELKLRASFCELSVSPGDGLFFLPPLPSSLVPTGKRDWGGTGGAGRISFSAENRGLLARLWLKMVFDLTL